MSVMNELSNEAVGEIFKLALWYLDGLTLLTVSIQTRPREMPAKRRHCFRATAV